MAWFPSVKRLLGSARRSFSEEVGHRSSEALRSEGEYTPNVVHQWSIGQDWLSALTGFLD